MFSVRAVGNPDEIKYKWTRNGSPIEDDDEELKMEGPLLNFTHVSRAHKGKYECTATNSEGATVLIIELDVQCKISFDTTSAVCIIMNTNSDLSSYCFPA